MMKALGIVRRIDDLGRVVLPKELRTTLGIAEKDGLEIYVEGESIILSKYVPHCTFCEEAEDVRPYRGKLVCASCREALGKGARH